MAYVSFSPNDGHTFGPTSRALEEGEEEEVEEDKEEEEDEEEERGKEGLKFTFES